MFKIITDIGFLRQKSEEVASIEEATSLISSIKKVLENIDNGIGLAAIQIGFPKKIAVLKVGVDENKEPLYLTLINPELEEAFDEIIFFREGCLSMPNYFQNTKRYRQIVIKNQVIDGDKFREERQMYYYPDGEDDNFSKNHVYTCIAIQHVLDHFSGGLIIDNVVKNNPIIKSQKIGRNDSCPCGSGKKYKKCCMEKDGRKNEVIYS
jgi:peptide deformylase